MRGSAIRKGVEEYLELRRGLGFVLFGEGRLLVRFVEFMERKRSVHITTDLALEWAMLPANAPPARRARRLGVVRRFARYFSATDPCTEIPPKGLLPHKYQRQAPRICTDRELLRVLAAARNLSLAAEVQSRTYYTLFGLLAVTGMRRGEAMGLARDDVDFTQGVLTIRRTKFHKSRLVPVHDSTRRALQQYARFRDQVFSKPRTDRFFVSDRGLRLASSTVDITFDRLSRSVGLRGPSINRAPRIHDFRHRFAIRTVTDWYRSGVDVEQQIPTLATYLGHTRVSHTYWYLSAVPELLQLAATRASKRGRRR